MKHELPFGVVMERLKSALGLSTDLDLAQLLGMSSSNYANRKASKSIPFDLVIPLCISRSVSLDWVFTGGGSSVVGSKLQERPAQPLDTNLLGEIAHEVAAAVGHVDPDGVRRIGLYAGSIYSQVANEPAGEKRKASIRESSALAAAIDRTMQGASSIGVSTGAAGDAEPIGG